MAINVNLAQSATLNNTSILGQVNSNSAILQTALTDAVSLSGQSPNQMLSNFDMNSNQILNLPPPATANSPARLVDVVSPATISSVPPVGTSGAVVGLLNANNTYSGTSTFSGSVNFTSNVNSTSSTSFFPQIVLTNTTSDINAGYFSLQKSRSGGAVLLGDTLGSVIFRGFQNGAYQNSAQITAICTFPPSGNVVPSEVIISTSTNGQLDSPFTIANGGWVGTTTNNNAFAGTVGEYIISTVAFGTPVSLTTATPANMTSIVLTAGDWDVSTNFVYGGNFTTTVSSVAGAISTTSATISTSSLGFTNYNYPASTLFNGSFNSIAFPTATVRLSLASTTTVYAVAYSSFAVSTCNVSGFIAARRAR